MASYTISPIWGAGARLFENNGNPLSGGKIYTYIAGTSTPTATYTTPIGNISNSNPIVANAAGRLDNEIWLQVGIGYKFVLKDANDVLIATYDNIPSIQQPPITNDASSIAYEQGYTVTAGNFTIGATYLITSVGNTDFTAIGAAANVTGIHFTATGVGSGTGTAEYSRTVQSKLQETVSITDFGAKCDCVITGYVGDTRTYTGTPDDEAIEAAIAYLISKNGGTLIFPGLSLCTRSVIISSNITLLGLNPHDCGVFFGQGASFGPYWIGTPYDSNDPYYGIITKVENVRISNMRISSFRRDPGESQVYPNIYKSWGVSGLFKNSIIENCYCDWMTYDFVDLTDNYDDGATYIGDNTIRNNLVENMGRHGITCRGTRNWIVQNNHIQDCALRGITAELDSIHQYANSYVVENNTISNTQTGLTLDSYPSSTNNISVFVKSNIITGTTGTNSAIFDMSVSTPSQGNVIFVATNQFDKIVGFKSSQYTTATNNIFNSSVVCETANNMVFSNNVIYGPISFNYSNKIALYDNTFNLKTAGSFNYAVSCANTNTKLLCENNIFNVSNGTYANLIDAYLISDIAVLRQNTLNVSGSGVVTQNVDGTALMYYNTFGSYAPSVYVEMTPRKVTSYNVLNAGTQTVNVLTNEISGLFEVYSTMSVSSSNNSWAKWIVQKYGSSFYSITDDGYSGGSPGATATINSSTGVITITNATGFTSHIFTTVKSL